LWVAVSLCGIGGDDVEQELQHRADRDRILPGEFLPQLDDTTGNVGALIQPVTGAFTGLVSGYPAARNAVLIERPIALS
jgi:hypothetical protein